MIKKYTDWTYEDGYCYECYCDNCQAILDGHYYGRYNEMYCKACLLEEEFTEVKELQEGETVKCSACELEIDECIMVYKDMYGKWYCEECFESKFKKDTSDAISEFNTWDGYEP